MKDGAHVSQRDGDFTLNLREPCPPPHNPTEPAELDLGAAREGAVAAVLEALRAIDGVRVITYARGVVRPLPARDDAEPDEAGCPDEAGVADDDPEEGAARG